MNNIRKSLSSLTLKYLASILFIPPSLANLVTNRNSFGECFVTNVLEWQNNPSSSDCQQLVMEFSKRFKRYCPRSSNHQYLLTELSEEFRLSYNVTKLHEEFWLFFYYTHDVRGIIPRDKFDYSLCQVPKM